MDEISYLSSLLCILNMLSLIYFPFRLIFFVPLSVFFLFFLVLTWFVWGRDILRLPSAHQDTLKSFFEHIDRQIY